MIDRSLLLPLFLQQLSELLLSLPQLFELLLSLQQLFELLSLPQQFVLLLSLPQLFALLLVVVVGLKLNELLEDLRGLLAGLCILEHRVIQQGPVMVHTHTHFDLLNFLLTELGMRPICGFSSRQHV